ncbi:MAG: DUF4011 domain-containing protein [Idiomarina sp.]|nr:DUF4011 domain-containing protein [Idiomarina sp.]
MDSQIDTSLASKSLENLRNRLLDLTSRNRLINFKHTKKSSLRIVDSLPDALAEMLTSEKEIRFLSVPEPTENDLIEAGYLVRDPETKKVTKVKEYPSAPDWAKYLGIDTSYDVPLEPEGSAHSKHYESKIQTLLYPHELETRLKNLFRTAESSVQETGANILFIAFGFLEWYETDDTKSVRQAPLYLLPVKLNKGRLNAKTSTYEYTVSTTGESIIANLSLREKLRTDFALSLPEVDEETTPESYFNSIEQTILESKQEWSIRRFVSLGLFNFSRLLMYLDLDPKRWPDNRLLSHEVVDGFLNGQNENPESEPGLGFGEEHSLDDIDDIHDKYPLISDADSSQHSALIDILEGKSLVIEGPPGTGKSQTITNVIAAALSQGKKVLFVAEKMAALDVVKTRLDAAGLGDFCLELHSHKTQKRRVLDDLKLRLDKAGQYRPPSSISTEISRYEELKSQLTSYAQQINAEWESTGLTLHEILCSAARYRNELGINPEQVHPEKLDGPSFDSVTQRRLAEHIERFKGVYLGILSSEGNARKIDYHPWFGVRNSNLQYFDAESVLSSLESWQQHLMSVAASYREFIRALGVNDDSATPSLSELQKLCEDLNLIPPLNGSELLDALPRLQGKGLLSAIQALESYQAISSLSTSLSEFSLSGIVQPNLNFDEYRAANEVVVENFQPEVTLGEAGQLLDELDTVIQELEPIHEHYEQIGEELGLNGKRTPNFHTDGLKDFGLVLDLIDSIPQRYLDLRSEYFENPDLDALLPELKQSLSLLNPLREQLKPYFDIEKLGSPTKLEAIQVEIDKTSLFCWTASSWWIARSELRLLALNNTTKLKDLKLRLPQAIQFAKELTKLRNNIEYEQCLEKLYKELDTDIEGLVSVRSWYKQIREEFGTGLGRRAALGNALVNMSKNTYTAVKAQSSSGLKAAVTEVNEVLERARHRFTPAVLLQDTKRDLLEAKDALARFVNELKTAVDKLDELASEDDPTFEALSERVKKLGEYSKHVAMWRSANVIEEIFQNQITLTADVQNNEPQQIAAFERTIALAKSISIEVDDERVSKFLVEEKNSDAFELVRTHAEALGMKLSNGQEAKASFSDIVHLDEKEWNANVADSLDQLIKRNQLALERPDSLSDWLDYLQQRELMSAEGLINLVRLLEVGALQPDQLLQGFSLGIYDKLAREILAGHKELAYFSGKSQEEVQKSFAKYDEKLKLLQSEAIAHKIDQTPVPKGNDAARVKEKSGLALIKWECDKKTRHIPVRQLVKRAGQALVALKPCFMMGPMSVAHYLEPGQMDFDLVIMDEASQIKPQDALGAIARGKQVVIVGDPKQLPPTSFFERAVDDEQEEDETTGVEESESILDATLPMFQARRLRWHYRSQHESLISFSNHSFYDDNLILFPSPNKASGEFGLKYKRLQNGCFINRKNMEEVRVIAEAVKDHIKARPNESLGVVAMNSEQQQHIERAIETLSKQDFEFQQILHRNASGEDPLFVKNLENVQGDERDVIFISMTYGPQEIGGRVFQRFGPINSDVGWRRLNVLFTRSKKRMHIFSSMSSDDIVVSETSKRGVRALRNFLRYCETGLLGNTAGQTGKEPDSDFEVAVIKALNDAGFECEPQVGESGFYIDIAVVDPGRPGRYLMGIECDGATYHSAKSARDRDRLRQEILERLGWRIRRIWSTDWFKNPKGQLKPIISELNALKTDINDVNKPEMPEPENIDSIVAGVEKEEQRVKDANDSASTLAEKLNHFDQQVIRAELPNTPENKRLLRPAMLESLIEYTPINRDEFLQVIPSYVRGATAPEEGKYLEQVFEIIELNI